MYDNVTNNFLLWFRICLHPYSTWRLFFEKFHRREISSVIYHSKSHRFHLSQKFVFVTFDIFG